MNRFGPAELLRGRAGFLENAAEAAFTPQSSTKRAEWLRPGYYLMQLRQYYSNRSRTMFRLTQPDSEPLSGTMPT